MQLYSSTDMAMAWKNSHFHTKVKESGRPSYLPIARGRIVGSIPFPRVLALCEMQTVSSKIWTCVVLSISYDNNHYIIDTLIKI